MRVLNKDNTMYQEIYKDQAEQFEKEYPELYVTDPDDEPIEVEDC